MARPHAPDKIHFQKDLICLEEFFAGLLWPDGFQSWLSLSLNGIIYLRCSLLFKLILCNFRVIGQRNRSLTSYWLRRLSARPIIHMSCFTTYMRDQPQNAPVVAAVRLLWPNAAITQLQVQERKRKRLMSSAQHHQSGHPKLWLKLMESVFAASVLVQRSPRSWGLPTQMEAAHLVTRAALTT